MPSRTHKPGYPLERWEWARAFALVNGITGLTQLVLLELAFRGNSDGTCFPSNQNMTKQLGISRHTVIRAIRDLQDAGALLMLRRGRPGGGRGSNQYRLTGAPAWITPNLPTVREEVFQPELEGPELSRCERLKTGVLSRSQRHLMSLTATPNVAHSDIEPSTEPSTEHEGIRESAHAGENGRFPNGRNAYPDFPLITEEFLSLMEKKFIKATFNVREEVEAALGHESAQKWPRTDVYAQRWLQREVDGGVGRSRMTPETDWTRDMMEGTD